MPSSSNRSLRRLLTIVVSASFSATSVNAFLLTPASKRPSILWPPSRSVCRHMSDDIDMKDNVDDDPGSSSSGMVEPLIEATIRYDDGGSNLTDRFKYKVNALMGNFDPVEGVPNDERADGNILNAILTFPLRYTFNIVGRTGGDDVQTKQYIDDVRNVVFEMTGDDEIVSKVTPRGKNFTKVQCEANVQSVAMLNMIYDNLDKLEMTVMRF